ncbi:DUF4014 domain-containing protein [Escherichia coli]|nr:DUF4014 family protein [Escherichia coli]EES3797565.1 DUF4014 domain-containing protein [Escherichia coli]
MSFSGHLTLTTWSQESQPGFLILFIVLMIPISPLIFVWAIGKIIEPVIELYNDVVWASFNTLHNKINPYKES